MPVVADGRGLLLSYFDAAGELRTVEHLVEVPLTARAGVLVQTPGTQRLRGDRVYVADLRQTDPKTGYQLTIERRSVWLERMMPKSSLLRAPLVAAVGPGSPAPQGSPAGSASRPHGVAKASPKPLLKSRKSRTKRRHRKRVRRPPRPARAFAAPAPSAPSTPVVAKRPQILLFSTSWCPSCRAARAFFQQKGVAFVEHDIERDSRAAAQYTAIAQARGLRPGAVPLIVVGNQVFLGFSRFKVELALNQLTGS